MLGAEPGKRHQSRTTEAQTKPGAQHKQSHWQKHYQAMPKRSFPSAITIYFWKSIGALPLTLVGVGWGWCCCHTQNWWKWALIEPIYIALINLPHLNYANLQRTLLLLVLFKPCAHFPQIKCVNLAQPDPNLTTPYRFTRGVLFKISPKHNVWKKKITGQKFDSLQFILTSYSLLPFKRTQP